MFTNKAKKDVLVMGRVGVDMYAHSPDVDFADSFLFVKHIGGSAGNMAVGLVRAGCTVGFYGKVASDMLGDFVFAYMHHQGIDTHGLTRTVGQAKTPLAICETKVEKCGVVLYRNNASDIHISSEDIESEYIKQFKALIITGTGLSQNPSADATYTAVQYAKKHNVTTILDLDYRLDAWQSKHHAHTQLQKVCKQVDCVIGNLEEFEVVAQSTIQQGTAQTDTVTIPDTWQVPACVQRYVAKLVQNGTTVLLKNGQQGCVVYRPNHRPIYSGVYTVKPLKPYGAGDAFASTLIAHLIQHGQTDTTWCQALLYGSTAGAMVVARMGCAYAIPTPAEIKDFIATYRISQPPIHI